MEESLIFFLTLFWPGIIKYIKDKLIFYFIISLNQLAVEPDLYPECEYHSRGNIRELKDFIITDKSNNVRNHTEDKIVIYKKNIDFLIEKLDHLLNKKNNFLFTVTFTFIII